MTLIELIITLVVVGVILYCINTFITMDPKIKNILNIAVVIIVAIWMLQATGLIGYMNNVRVR